LEYGKDVYSAVASPRVHHQLMPNMVITERGFDKRIEKELIKRNHTIFRLPSKYCVSAVQIVKRNEDGTIEAASDPRKMGLAAAY
jgi:gamma-glutamyltranspeptidase/glutathione hydrolase/leukotriene-C4 hydrolase